MNADGRLEPDADTRRVQQRALEDATRRLVSLAGDLTPEPPTEAALRRTAVSLEALVRRFRWLADVSSHD